MSDEGIDEGMPDEQSRYDAALAETDDLIASNGIFPGPLLRIFRTWAATHFERWYGEQWIVRVSLNVTLMGFSFIVLISCIALMFFFAFNKPPSMALFQKSDKLNHFLAFGATALFMPALLPFPRFSTRFLLVFFVLTLFAVGIEVAQYYFKAQASAEVFDIVADLAGLIVGDLCGCLLVTVIQVLGMKAFSMIHGPKHRAHASVVAAA